MSTNHVYRVALDDGHHVIAKVSSYGSYFLFAEDHDRLHTLRSHCSTAPASRGCSPTCSARRRAAYTWYDGKIWVVFYEEVDRLGIAAAHPRATTTSRTSAARSPTSTSPAPTSRRRSRSRRSRSSPTRSTCSTCWRARHSSRNFELGADDLARAAHATPTSSSSTSRSIALRLLAEDPGADRLEPRQLLRRRTRTTARSGSSAGGTTTGSGSSHGCSTSTSCHGCRAARVIARCSRTRRTR